MRLKWLERRDRADRIKKRIQDVWDEFYAELSEAKEGDQTLSILNAISCRTLELEEELQAIEDAPLLQKASQFGLKPSSDDVYEGTWRSGLLTDSGRANMSRAITAARFEYWKKWTELIVPTLSLLVTVLALYYNAPQPANPEVVVISVERPQSSLELRSR